MKHKKRYFYYRKVKVCYFLSILTLALVTSCSGGGSGTGPSVSSSSSSSSTSSSSSASSASSSTSSSSSSSSSTSSSSSSGTVSLLTEGKALFAGQGCAGCHGDLGEGGSSGGSIIPANWSLKTLTDQIRDTMPKGSPASCDQACAEAVATYILSWRTEKACNGQETLLPRRLRLLSPHEYQLTINNLFGLGSDNTFASILPRTEPVRGYDNNAPEIQVTYAHATQYWTVAETVSQNANLKRVADCSSLSKADCAALMLSNFGEKIFRRPLSQEEKNTYTELFNTETSVDDSMRQVLKSMLISPNFLYRSEVGEPDGKGGFQLTAYETASLLSYTFWGTLPDTELLSLAKNNSLNQPDILLAQTQRLLLSTKAEAQLSYFAKEWLDSVEMGDIYRDPVVFPGFDWSMAQAMLKEFQLFFGDAFLNQSSRFQDLFTADYVFANKILADFYGLSGPTTSTFKRIDAGSQRGGILNLGGVLAVHAKMDQTSPISRGVFVRERLLCQDFPPPPPNGGGAIPLDPTLSSRERFSAHTDNDGCRLCHEKIDPIGFSFEKYDGSGHYRELEGNNISVDDSGSLTGIALMSDTDYQAYSGTKGLSQILAHSSDAAYCFADQFHTYLQGVKQPDSCTLKNVVSRWSQKDYTLYDLWIEAVKSPSFLKRQ